MMKVIPSVVSIVTMVVIQVVAASGAGAAAPAPASVSAAVFEAVTSMPGGRRRWLAHANADCAREAEALDECARPTLADAAGAWADCVVAAYLGSQAGGPAAATNSTSSEDATCDALRAFTCSPVAACPALASCVDEYTPYADCLMTAEQNSLALLCDVSCGSYSSSPGNNGTDAGTGTNGRRTEASESTSSSYTPGAGMIRAFAAAAGLAAVHAFT
jgi:hypothetical protein